jgi:DNA-binding NtrC family response regulator
MKDGSMKLLIVDDEAPILESLKAALKPSGYECVVTQKPREAVEAFKRDGFDVVITDFMMPEMNGIELLKEVKNARPDANVIILTGYADIENAIAAVNNGAYAFFRKPLDFRDFMNTLRKLESELSGKKEKEIDMQHFLAEYTRLKDVFESLQDVVQKMGADR